MKKRSNTLRGDSYFDGLSDRFRWFAGWTDPNVRLDKEEAGRLIIDRRGLVLCCATGSCVVVESSRIKAKRCIAIKTHTVYTVGFTLVQRDRAILRSLSHCSWVELWFISHSNTWLSYHSARVPPRFDVAVRLSRLGRVKE